MIQIKRAYERSTKNDGARFLVERLWPRGVKKENLQAEDWLKELAPSSELRKWFQHDPAKWGEFRQRYFRELEKHPDMAATAHARSPGAGDSRVQRPRH